MAIKSQLESSCRVGETGGKEGGRWEGERQQHTNNLIQSGKCCGEVRQGSGVWQGLLMGFPKPPRVTEGRASVNLDGIKIIPFPLTSNEIYYFFPF